MGERAWEQPALWNASKFQIPKTVPWWLRREKLLSSIESGDEGVVVFHAGAGYGKTTVMAEWAASHRAKSCWYRLHESDNHFYRFLYGIAAALSGAVDADLFDVHGMKLTGREKPGQVSELFFSRCIPALPEDGFFICLDDFQQIYDDTVLDFLLRFMEYGEGRARFFFSLRGGFPGFLAACLMRGTAREVKEDELRFEEQESAALLRRLSGRELPKKIVREIHKDTNGWPAGIAFAGLDLKEERELPGRVTQPVREMQPKRVMQLVCRPLFDRTRLYDYLFYEIFRKLAYDTQTFLTESSALERMTPPLCDAALGRSDAAGMLRYLVRENLFVSRQEEEQDVYCYDHVFKEFLRSRLSAGRCGDIMLKAAEYEARRGAWETAAGYGMQCGEKGCALVAAALEKRAVEMTASGQQVLLQTWIDHLYGFRGKLADTTLYCMYELLCRAGDRQRGEELLLAAAERARAKLRYDSYERYMREYEALREAGQEHGVAEQRDGGAVDGKKGGIGHKNRGIEDEKKGGIEQKKECAADGDTLFVQCMGSFSVRGTGGEITWRTKKTKELFACLFYECGRWVTRDVLTERLWPEKAAEKSAVLFHTTASYLRRALAGAGGADYLLVKNQSYALDMTRIKSDIGVLDESYAYLKEGKTLSRERAEALLKLYERGYLCEEDYLWIGAYGEEVEQRYLWMMNMLADRASAKKKYEDAAVYLKKALEVDGYALAVMERLVECLLRCRSITGAKRMYERLRQTSLEVIGEEPSRTFEDYLVYVDH